MTDRGANIPPGYRLATYQDGYEAGYNAARTDRAELEALRTALEKAAGRLGYLSTVLSFNNKPSNAKGAWEWSEEARAALAATARPAAAPAERREG